MIPAGRIALFRRAGSFFSLLAVLAAVSGCVSATKELAREESAREAEWDVLAAKRPASVTLDWNAALGQLRAHNQKVLSADLDIKRAYESLDQVKRSLIPTADLSAGYERLLDTPGVQIEPFTFAATGFFDVPGVFSYRVRYQAAVLTLAHARLVRETVWRGQVIDLYRAVLEGRGLDARLARLEQRRSALAALASAAPETAARERAALADERREVGRLHDDWLLRAGEILGMPQSEITLSDTGLPPLPYAAPADRPDPARLAQLPLKLAALDLLALRARRLGITLQEWPEVQMAVSSPTIYEAGDGASDYVWSPRQLFVSVTSFWTLDTQGKHASDRRLLDGEMTYRREVLEQEAEANATKLRRALDGLADTDRRLDAVDKALTETTPSLRSRLIDAKDSLMEDRRDWSLTLWFFDDSRWPDNPS